MTESGVGRVSRTSYPRPVGSPAGSRAALRPPVQGAQRRTRRRVRWGLRALIVSGLAGAAWLLTGAAAYAADRVDEPTGSLLGSVLDADATRPVTGLLTAAAQPLETVRPARVLDVPRRVLARPAHRLVRLDRPVVNVALHTVDRVVREVTGPIRLDGAVSTRALLTLATRPVTTRPVTVGLVSPTGSVAVTRPIRSVKPVHRPVRASHHPVVSSVRPVRPVSLVNPVSTVDRAPGSVVWVRGTPTSRVVQAGRIRHGAIAYVHRHRIVPTVRAGRPSGGGPVVPLQLHLRNVGGTSTSASETSTQDGSPAFLPAGFADSAMACQRLPIPSNIQARRYDVKEPTVSPD